MGPVDFVNLEPMAHCSLAVAKRILQRRPGLTPMQLIKLVYLCHGWMLGMRGQPLISDPVEAWAYGPVIRKVYDAVRQYGSNPIMGVVANDEIFTADEDQIINWITDFYSQYSGIRLSNMTHMPGSPWYKTWNEFGKNANISNDLMQEYYARQGAQSHGGAAS